MANQVYANNNELACKAGSGKSICCFPDVCMTPPENPATPPGVPVPYPNTGMASDTTNGSRTVMISGQEVMIKDSSYFKTSTGDEAGCAAKKGVVTSVNRGEVYFTAWSMNVKIEDENVDRHLDITLHNEACNPPNAATMVFIDSIAVEVPVSCAQHAEENNTACSGAEPQTEDGRAAGVDCDTAADPETCKKARTCLLMAKDMDKSFCCKPDSTGHHMIEDQWIKTNSSFPWYRSNRRGAGQSLSLTPAERAAGIRTVDDAPCVCVFESADGAVRG